MSRQRSDRDLARRTGSLAATQDVILVIGDWLVDEHWVVGVHRSSSASRTGDKHRRALHSPDSVVQAFCGAGRSAYFLHQLYKPDHDDGQRTFPSLMGLGFWHPDDDDALVSLFDPKAQPTNFYRMTPHFNKASSAARQAGIELVNMNAALNHQKGSERAAEYTTRIIRIYQVENNHITYERLDWEWVPPGVTPWKPHSLAELERTLRAKLGERRVRAVMIKDMRKGAVSPQLIDWLVRLDFNRGGERPRWYVSTKEWWPQWLSSLKSVDLRLFMVPQVPAQEAIRKRKLSCWLTRSGWPSREALGWLERIAEASGAKTVYVLSEWYSALAYSKVDKKVEYAVQATPPRERPPVEMGGASIFFPAVVACMENEQMRTFPLKAITDTALAATAEWVENEAQRIFHPEDWKPEHFHDPSVFSRLRHAFHDQQRGRPYHGEKLGSIGSPSWNALKDEWDEALSEVGIIKRHRGGEIQLWRSMLDVEGYVCCDTSHRRSLRGLVQGIHAFARSGRHHASCMLVAGPGSGKSFLARRLAQAARLELVAFNITQMRSNADIVECFARIMSEQSQHPRKRFLVFMDEINAPLDGEAPYSAFLTPLEDGTFVHDGRPAQMQPCIWVFAGTHDPREKSRQHNNASPTPKLSDFLSRLTLGVFDLLDGTPAEEDPEDGKKEIEVDDPALERVYLGVSLLKAEYPEVQRISEAVLRAFRSMPPAVKSRDLKHFIRRFEDIQRNEVKAASVPSRWPCDLDHKAERDWRMQLNKGNYADVANIRILQ